MKILKIRQNRASAFAVILFSSIFLPLPALAADLGSLGHQAEKAGRAAISTIHENTLIGKFNPLSFAFKVQALKLAEKKARAALMQATAVLAKARRLGDREAEEIANAAVRIAKSALAQTRKNLTSAHAFANVMATFKKGLAARLSRALDEIAEKRYNFYTDPALERRLRGIVARLKRFSLKPEDRILIRILNTADPDEEIAMASATTIYFGKAYLESGPSEDELAFIAAHEMSHAELDHMLLKLAYVTELRFKEFLLGKKEAVLPPRMNPKDPRVKRAIKRVLKEITRGQYSKERELEADLLGAKVAIAAGAHPRGIRQTMDRIDGHLRRLNLDRGRTAADQRLDDLRSTHPLPSKRLKVLERHLGPRFWE